MKRILSVCEKNPKEDKSLVTLVSRKHEIFSECAFVLLQGVVDRSKFTSNYSVLLADVIN